MPATYSGDVDAIAAINTTILAPYNGVAFDSTNLPPTIGITPAALTIVAPGDWTKFGTDEFVIRVYVQPVQNGNPATAYQQCLTLLQAFFDTYGKLASVNNRPLMRVTHGSGKTPHGFGTSGFYFTQKWSSTEFYGFEVYLPLGPR